MAIMEDRLLLELYVPSLSLVDLLLPLLYLYPSLLSDYQMRLH